MTKTYDLLIFGLAGLALMSIVAMAALILGDVSMRYAGIGSIRASSTLIEYALLFSTMMGAPWLVRRRGHITVTSLVDMLPAGGRRGAGLVALAVSIITLGILGWRAAVVAHQKWMQGGMDIRSIAVPDWVSYAILAAGFLLMATECIRLVLRGEITPAGAAAS
ncbi:MAG: TRAP transporter small permease [Paracoccus sp. (in: a-proteobacteria)]|nr:TRAP transporter small permease [Paracoccus sp. (in: a-proteobacteria)]